jgi:hypothetical protein
LRFFRGGGNSTVESHSSKVMVAGSNPVPRSNGFAMWFAYALHEAVDEFEVLVLLRN